MRFALALAVLLTASPSFAEDSAAPLAPPPLAPGKPAGVAQAEMNNHDLFIYLSLGLVAVGAAGMVLIFTRSSASSPTTTQ